MVLSIYIPMNMKVNGKSVKNLISAEMLFSKGVNNILKDISKFSVGRFNAELVPKQMFRKGLEMENFMINIRFYENEKKLSEIPEVIERETDHLQMRSG